MHFKVEKFQFMGYTKFSFVEFQFEKKYVCIPKGIDNITGLCLSHNNEIESTLIKHVLYTYWINQAGLEVFLHVRYRNSIVRTFGSWNWGYHRWQIKCNGLWKFRILWVIRIVTKLTRGLQILSDNVNFLFATI